jgi:DNA primase small subunit
MKEREFGFFLLTKKIMLRHKGFDNIDGFRTFLKKIVPSNVYYSSAYFEKPEAKMEEKGWLGADLIFDVDADHIPTPCDKIHDRWICRNCGYTGRGFPPEKCLRCSEKIFGERVWPCEICLASAKLQIIRLIDILTKDFGFSSKEMKVYFSGHRGYHLHMESEKTLTLDAMARREIVDYILGIGLNPKFLGLRDRIEGRVQLVGGPDLSDSGWSGRMAKGTYDFLLTTTAEELEKKGLMKNAANAIIKHREELLRSWRKKGPWGIVKDVGIESWIKIARQGIESQSVKIDALVTPDIHRLIRYENTLHGKTGLKKTFVPLNDIDRFDPLESSLVFKNEDVKVFVSEAPKFRLGNQIFGPYKNQEIKLPIAAALMLMCKEVAKVEDKR